MSNTVRDKIDRAIDNILRDKSNIVQQPPENNYDAGRYDAYKIVLGWLDEDNKNTAHFHSNCCMIK